MNVNGKKKQLTQGVTGNYNHGIGGNQIKYSGPNQYNSGKY